MKLYKKKKERLKTLKEVKSIKIKFYDNFSFSMYCICAKRNVFLGEKYIPYENPALPEDHNIIN